MKKLLLITLATGFMVPSGSVKAMDYVNRENIVATSLGAGIGATSYAALKYITAGASESDEIHMHDVKSEDYKDLYLYVLNKDSKTKITNCGGGAPAFYKNYLIDLATKNPEKWNTVVSECDVELQEVFIQDVKKKYLVCKNINKIRSPQNNVIDMDQDQYLNYKYLYVSLQLKGYETADSDKIESSDWYKNALIEFANKNEEKWNAFVSKYEKKYNNLQINDDFKAEEGEEQVNLKKIMEKRYMTCKNINTTIKQQERRNSAKKWF